MTALIQEVITSSTESQQRKKVSDVACASVRLERFVLAAEVESLYAQSSVKGRSIRQK